MKNFSTLVACIALLGISTMGFTHVSPEEGAMVVEATEEAVPAVVLNFGRDSVICVATGDFFAIGRLTVLVGNDGGQTLFACNGDVIFPTPESTTRGDLDCGPFGTGSFVVTKSGKFNGTCHQ